MHGHSPAKSQQAERRVCTCTEGDGPASAADCPLGHGGRHWGALSPAVVRFWQIGKLGRKGKIKPGMRLIPVAFRFVPCPLEGIDTELEVECECIDFEPDPATGLYPRVWLPQWTYESASLYGEKTYWRQLPLKVLLLRTLNSLQGKGISKLLLVLDYVWLYNQIFSGVTRATVPPPRLTDCLAEDGAVGIKVSSLSLGYADPASSLKLLHPRSLPTWCLCSRTCTLDLVLTPSNQRPRVSRSQVMPAGNVFSPTSLALGLHPKVALLWAHYNKVVPAEVIKQALEWKAKHQAYYIKCEEDELELRLAAISAPMPTFNFD